MQRRLSMFCEKCGNQLNDNDKFCQKCGAPVNPLNAAPQQVAAAPQPEVQP
ncbi:MAG: zinc-ribbon domain-containing protein, partial [Ruminococcus sp.]|nr:zinc-ribbon domain-containing protein [Ruminococcus sp.]